MPTFNQVITEAMVANVWWSSETNSLYGLIFSEKIKAKVRIAKV